MFNNNEGEDPSSWLLGDEDDKVSEGSVPWRTSYLQDLQDLHTWT